MLLHEHGHKLGYKAVVNNKNIEIDNNVTVRMVL